MFFILRPGKEKQPENKRLWQKTQYENLVRNRSSGIYFARFRHNGKLIWRGLDTDVLSTAAWRLPDKINEIKDKQALLASGSDLRIGLEGAAKIYLERVKSSPFCGRASNTPWVTSSARGASRTMRNAAE